VGRAIYNSRCYFCHGYGGDAHTLAGTYLDPAPRDFTALKPGELSRTRMLEAVRDGVPDSAMMAFASVLSETEIAAVVDFVDEVFIRKRRDNTRYHTPENGWADHDRYRGAFPFALGQVALDTPLESLSADERRGRRLFMSACVTCHDRAVVRDEGPMWDARPVSIPRAGYDPRGDGWSVDAQSGATPYARHERRPVLAGLDAEQRLGERLFQGNCAFCHGADGTGHNWIGSFLEPHPRDLTALRDHSRAHLREVIREGLPGTTMSAWKFVLTDAEIDAIIAYVLRAFVNVPAADG